MVADLSAAEREELRTTPEWDVACRVAASQGLSKSELLPRFLLYVCQEYLLGRAQEISEQRIGICVFNRPPGYDPGEDNIVRSYARLLRKRLDAYFANEGSNEPMRITIERGGYVPTFHSKLTLAPSLADSTPGAVDGVSSGAASRIHRQLGDESPPIVDPRYSSRSIRIALAAGALAGVLLTLATWAGVTAIQARRHLGPAHALWMNMFPPDRNTLIVPADSGLGILENLTRHPVNVEEYANGSFLSDLQIPSGLDQGNFNDLRVQRYTSVVDLDIASKLMSLPEVVPSRTQIHYARGMTPEDIKNANIILLGSKHTNPWVSLFESRMNFQLDYMSAVDDSYVLNVHPSGTEQKIYRNDTSTVRSSTYGSIAYLTGLGGKGHVLIIQGLNMAGTQAAADALFNSAIIRPVLEQAKLPDGTLRSFELLVHTANVGATAPEVQVIATRIYPL